MCGRVFQLIAINHINLKSIMKTHKYIKPFGALAGLAISVTTSQAAISYVDAQEGVNTFATGGSLADESWVDSTSNTSGVDNANWVKRSGGTPGWTEHNGGDVIQGLVDPLAGNTLGEITTQVTGLADGNYDVWVFFWEQTVSGTQNWVIDAGLTSGSLTSYSSSAGSVVGTDSITPVAASTLSFSNSPAVLGAGGNQSMYGINLGQVAVTGGADINVYVDKIFGNTSNNRTIYDGIGYELVSPIPEPSSTALLGLGGLALVLRRRR